MSNSNAHNLETPPSNSRTNPARETEVGQVAEVPLITTNISLYAFSNQALKKMQQAGISGWS